jgi:hypothetical protein
MAAQEFLSRGRSVDEKKGVLNFAEHSRKK